MSFSLTDEDYNSLGQALEQLPADLRNLSENVKLWYALAHNHYAKLRRYQPEEEILSEERREEEILAKIQRLYQQEHNALFSFDFETISTYAQRPEVCEYVASLYHAHFTRTTDVPEALEEYAENEAQIQNGQQTQYVKHFLVGLIADPNGPTYEIDTYTDDFIQVYMNRLIRPADLLNTMGGNHHLKQRKSSKRVQKRKNRKSRKQSKK